MIKVHDRFAAAGIVVFLQIGFVALLLRAMPSGVARQNVSNETFFMLHRLVIPEAVRPIRKLRKPVPNGFLVTPPPIIPSIPDVSMDRQMPPADLRSFGSALSGCSIENLSNLSSEDRARCGHAFTPPSETAAMQPPSLVKDPKRRAAELAARNAPVRVSCTKVEIQGVGPNEQVTAALDPFYALSNWNLGVAQSLGGLPS